MTAAPLGPEFDERVRDIGWRWSVEHDGRMLVLTELGSGRLAGRSVACVTDRAGTWKWQLSGRSFPHGVAPRFWLEGELRERDDAAAHAEASALLLGWFSYLDGWTVVVRDPGVDAVPLVVRRGDVRVATVEQDAEGFWGAWLFDRDEALVEVRRRGAAPCSLIQLEAVVEHCAAVDLATRGEPVPGEEPDAPLDLGLLERARRSLKGF